MFKRLFFKKIPRLVVHLFPIIAIFILNIIFFAKLFFPPSIFVTPDFGRTDILHIELAQKYILATHLKQFSLPFWETGIGQGYPIFAELLGTFNIINIFTLLLLPFEIAIPTIYLLTFLITGIGMYYLLIWLKLSKSAALFGSIAFNYSAAMIMQISHLIVIQAIAFLPLSLLVFLKFLKVPSLQYFALLTLLFSQTLLTFPQVFIYLFIFLTILGITNLMQKSKIMVLKFLFQFSLILASTFLLSSVQLLPSYELFKHSYREESLNPQGILNKFPLLPKNLLTFLNPFIIGKAADGTYNSTNWAKQGIYWENTAYIGLLPFFFSIWAIFRHVSGNKKSLFFLFSILAVLTILLALGKNSPLHVIYSLPPLSYFRIPGRFLLFTQLFLAILAARGLNQLFSNLQIRARHGVIAIIIVITTIDLLNKWWNYHPVGKFDEWFASPETAQIILQNNYQQTRIYSIGSTKNWNDVFTNHGWENQLENYKFFRNALDPNVNLYYGLNNLTGYQLLLTRRQALQQLILQKNISFSDSVEISPIAKKILDQNAVFYLITTTPLETAGYQKLAQFEKNNFKYFVYENNSANAIAKVYYDYQLVDSIGDYWQVYNNVDTNKTVILEKNPKAEFKEGNAQIQTLKSAEGYRQLKVSTDKDGILVISSSFYPGWQAQINSNPAQIYAANINSQAIIIPKGENIVEFSYKPTYFKTGLLISAISFGILISLILKSSKLFNRFIKLLFLLLHRPL